MKSMKFKFEDLAPDSARALLSVSHSHLQNWYSMLIQYRYEIAMSISILM